MARSAVKEAAEGERTAGGCREPDDERIEERARGARCCCGCCGWRAGLRVMGGREEVMVVVVVVIEGLLWLFDVFRVVRGGPLLLVLLVLALALLLIEDVKVRSWSELAASREQWLAGPSERILSV